MPLLAAGWAAIIAIVNGYIFDSKARFQKIP